MKKLIQLFTVVMVLSAWTGANAADLIVEDAALPPNYSTIQAAVDAAVAGDRIFVKNKPGGAAYVEDVVIDKPIELLPFDAETLFIVDGEYSNLTDVAHFTQPDEAITIIGMHNLNGSIIFSSANATVNDIIVNIHGCDIAGSIEINHSDFNVNITGSSVSGIIARYGNIIGNDIDSGSIFITSPSGTNNDTILIVGNRINVGGINWNSLSNYFYIANNWIFSPNGTPIGLLSQRSFSGTNTILNNTLSRTNIGGSSIQFQTLIANTTTLFIANNILDGNNANPLWPAISFAGGINPTASVYLYYNSYDDFDNGLANTLVNTITSGNVNIATEYDLITGGCFPTAVNCYDLGHPGDAFTDHDLTRNDLGTGGGSFNYTNFFPLFTGGARVFMVNTPRTVLPGATIRAEAVGYDR